MATATASRPSGPVLSIPSYRSASPTRVNLPARSPGKSVSVSSPKQAPTASRLCSRRQGVKVFQLTFNGSTGETTKKERANSRTLVSGVNIFEEMRALGSLIRTRTQVWARA